MFLQIILAAPRVDSKDSVFIMGLFFVYAFSVVFRKLFDAIGETKHQDPEKQKQYDQWVLSHGKTETVKCVLALVILLICLGGGLYAVGLKYG